MNIDYLLFSGKDIPLKNGLKIKQYSISDINENGIGYDRYEFIIWAMTRYSYEFKFDLEDSGIDYNKLKTYDIFLMLIKQHDSLEILEDIEFIFGESFSPKDGYLTSNSGAVLNEESIEEIKEILCKSMFFKKPKERKPANKEAKDLIKKQIKKNRNKRVEYDIYSIMYALVLSPNCSETFESMLDRTPHQIYASYFSIQKQKDFDNTMSGIYSGVIKSKDIEYKKINWINKIN